MWARESENNAKWGRTREFHKGPKMVGAGRLWRLSLKMKVGRLKGGPEM